MSASNYSVGPPPSSNSDSGSIDQGAPILLSSAINKVEPQAISNGWYPLHESERIMIEVNWGQQRELSLVHQWGGVCGGSKDENKHIRVQLRWSSEKGERKENDQRLWEIMDHVSFSDREEEERKENHTSQKTRIVSEPSTIEGQQVGALLQVMRIPERIKKVKKGAEFNMILEVGDICEVIEKQTISIQGKDRIDYVVDNLRTGAQVLVPWNTFLKVGTREMCACARQCCRCVYVDYGNSQRFFAAL